MIKLFLAPFVVTQLSNSSLCSTALSALFKTNHWMMHDATIGTASTFTLLMEPIDGVEAGAVDDVSTPTVKKSVEKN